MKLDSTNRCRRSPGSARCFNELGWASLRPLDSEDKDAIFQELFAPGVGANFNICRMPIGANDFSLDWYSYDEVPGDFALKRFRSPMTLGLSFHSLKTR